MNTSPFLVRGLLALSLSVLALGGCYAAGDDEAYSESNGMGDLPIGSVEGDSTASASGGWVNATRCKDIPNVPALTDPEIIVSLDGLTLHLRDRAGDYDRVFPVGVGALGPNGQSITPTSEDTPTGLFHTGRDTRPVADGAYGYYYPCKVWWSENGVRKPVFAGLPFIRLSGTPSAGYGIHGPIDNFDAPNGGALRRGYVSHGCVRMAAADIVEVYARIRGRASVPVRIQKEVERDATSSAAVDLASRWVGAECSSDADCNFDGGRCHLPSDGSAGTCTLSCTHACPDRVGEVPTFCVPEPGASGGMCVPTDSSVFDNHCARYEGRLSRQINVSRPDHSSRATVCVPGA